MISRQRGHGVGLDRLLGNDPIAAGRARPGLRAEAILCCGPLQDPAASTRSRTDKSSFSGSFTRVEMGHSVIGSDGKGAGRSRGSGSMSPATYHSRLRDDHRHAVVDGRAGDDSERAHPLSVSGRFQFSQMAAMANGSPDFIPIA